VSRSFRDHQPDPLTNQDAIRGSLNWGHSCTDWIMESDMRNLIVLMALHAVMVLEPEAGYGV